MLQRRPVGGPPAHLPDRARRLLWSLTGLDVMAATWMATVGDWFDTQSRLTAVVTLGGHHLVALWLAVTGSALLAGLAVATSGFAVANRLQRALLAVAGVVSVVALAGPMSVLGVLVGGLLLGSHVARAILR